MKARVKATGEIVEIVETDFVASNGMIYDEEDLIISKDEPDYWEKLKHQYAGMAIQGIMTNIVGFESVRTQVNASEVAAEIAKDYATALVNRLMEEEK